MTSVLNHQNVDLFPHQLIAGLRLVLGSSPGMRGSLDGCWWPHSHEAQRELPTLLAAAQDGFQVVVSKASMGTTFWDSAPEKITVGDRIVQVAWVRAHDAHTIRLLSGKAWHADLLVIPPGTPSAVAREALAMVARKDHAGAVNDLLSSASGSASGSAASGSTASGSTGSGSGPGRG